MADLTKQEKELMLELIDDAYANQMIVIEESGDSPEYDDKLRLDDFQPSLSEDNQNLEDYLDKETAKEIEQERQQAIEGA